MHQGDAFTSHAEMSYCGSFRSMSPGEDDATFLESEGQGAALVRSTSAGWVPETGRMDAMARFILVPAQAGVALDRRDECRRTTATAAGTAFAHGARCWCHDRDGAVRLDGHRGA